MFLFLVAYAQAQDSVLFPLAFGESCWSNVTIQNVTEEDASVWLTAHKSSGALAPLSGAATSRVSMKAGVKIALRLQVEGEEDRQAWVQMKEYGGQSIALSGAVECLDGGELKSVAAAVIFPARNPWIRGDVADFHSSEVWMLNSSASPATASLCYSNGVYAQAIEICSDEEDLFLPPFGMRTVPVLKHGNSRFSLRATGEAIALRLVVPGAEKKKKFAVDSSIQFADVPAALKQ